MPLAESRGGDFSRRADELIDVVGFVDQGTEAKMISDPEIGKTQRAMLVLCPSIVGDEALYVTVYRDLSDFRKI